MKRFIILVLGMVLFSGIYAQELKFHSYGLKETDLTAKVNPVYDLNNEPCALLRVAVASQKVTFKGNIVGEPVYDSGEWLVYLLAGTRQIKISVEGFLPYTQTFSAVEGYRTYELRLTMPDLKSKSKESSFLLLPGVSINSVQTSYGFMMGYVKKKHGFYTHIQSNFGHVDTDISCNKDGYTEHNDALSFTGDKKKSRWAVTAGYMYRLIKPLYLYGGIGYGSRILAWESTGSNTENKHPFLVKVEDSSVSGVECEVGAIYRIGLLGVSAGVQTNQFKYTEFNIGVGLIF